MKIKSFILLSLLLTLVGSKEYASALTIHTIGDSTMEYKDPATTENGQRGWTQLLDLFVTNGAVVNNRAKSGTSSKTFYEGVDANGNKRFWATVIPQIKAGDYVFIQFGHNDEKDGGVEGEIGTNPWQSYTLYLKKYVAEVRELGATPILFTPVVRNQFSNGLITDKGAHNLGMGTDGKPLDYPGAMKAVAEELNCLLVDHTALTKAVCEEYGPTKVSDLIYNVGDGTHLGEYGATLYARLAVQDLIRQGILTEYLNADPQLLISPMSWDFGKCYLNTVTTYPFSVSGIDLSPQQGEVSVVVSDGFTISNELNGSYSQTLSLPYDNGNLSIVTIYVKYAPESLGVSQGVVTFTYSEGSTKTVELKGECVSFEGGQQASVYWELSANEDYVSEGAVTVIPETFSNMYVGRYAKPGSTTIWEDGMVMAETKTQRNIILGDSWPTEIDIDNDRYIQFGVTATKGTVFNVDSIGLYVGGSGTNGMKFRVLLDKDESFGNPTMIADRQSNTSNTMYPISYTRIIELRGEESLYLRVYPWLNNAASAKSICLYGVLIKGVIAADEGSGIGALAPDGGSNVYCSPTATAGSTTLNYALDKDSELRIRLLSSAGTNLWEMKRKQVAGAHREEVDLSAFPAGVYFCTLLSDSGQAVARIIRK